LRIYFFWQLFLTGKGKLSNIGKVSEFFRSGPPIGSVFPGLDNRAHFANTSVRAGVV
jgi:hypothetical protein